MVQKSMKISRSQEVNGGALVGLEYDDVVWHFKFENLLVVESLGGWRLFDPFGEKKTLLGSRDIEDSLEPFRQISDFLEGYGLRAFHFGFQRDSLDLVLFNSGLDEQRSIELQKTSARMENWRIVGEDFVDSDKLELISRLETRAPDGV